MLNVPTAEREDAERMEAAREDANSQNAQPSSQELQRRRLRRRPLSGDRVHGWADVRKLEQDGTGVEKYQVNLNATAHLNWTEWQLMREAEPSEVQDATWCIIPGDDEDSVYDGEEREDAEEVEADRNSTNQSETHTATQDDYPLTRNQRQRASSTGSNSSAGGARFVRRHSQSPQAEATSDAPAEHS